MTTDVGIADRIQQFPRRRTYLLPALHEVHEAYGWLPGDALELIGAHLRVPKSEVYGIASSFPDFRLEEPASEVTRLCLGASCRTLGAEPSHGVERADCLFICGVGPASEVDHQLIGRSGTRSPVPKLTANTLIQDGSCSRAVADVARAGGKHVGCAGNCWQAPAVSTDGGYTWTSANVTWTKPGEPRVSRFIGHVDPYEPYTYEALEIALGLGSDKVWQLVKDSGLRGRGGAYFPVGIKWETARTTPSQKKFLLVNAEEGEPGIYKDRHLIEGDPHRVVEGVMIAALGIGATNVVIFLNGDARLSQERLMTALDKARQLEVVHVPTEVRLGAGGYVLGEETALINALHGQRAEPLARPPFPAVSGLESSPTVINNVETLANLPDMVRNDAEWFRSVGTASTPGTKLVSLAGAVRQPGLYEVPLGTPISQILTDCGGGVRGELRAALVGGPSGSVLPPSLLDTPLDVQPLQGVGGVLGAGGIVPLTTSQCVVAAVRELVAYNARESCGKCTPCREGTHRMLRYFDELCGGNGKPETLERIDDLNDVLSYASLCGLGQMAPNPVRALLRHFADDVREHLDGGCAAGVCGR